MLLISYGFYSLGLLVLSVIVSHIISTIRFNRTYKFPNVVKGLPLIGSLFDTPYPAGMWGIKMAKQYNNEMFTQKNGGRHLVFLNASDIVEDVLEKRSIVNSRPARPNLLGVMSANARMVMLPYTEKWRNQRRITHGLLNSIQAAVNFTPYQNLESKHLVYDILKKPDMFHRASQRFSNSVILSVVFGRRARVDDELLNYILEYTKVLGEFQFNPLANPADFLPFLWYLPKPLQWWRPAAEAFNLRCLDIYGREVQALKNKIDHGTAKPCFAVDFLQGQIKAPEMTEVEQIYTLVSIVEAGSDTTRTAVLQMMAGAACYPAWVAKARKVLDEVCGANAERLPVLGDKERLPYITAVMKETLRWRPFLQTGVPHTSSEDFEYKGYKFPAGTEFTWNAYNISLNENEYANPEEFFPDRFMNDDLDKYTKGHWAFGAGRRVCGGLNVGVTNTWIACAVLLYCFDFAEDPEHPIDQFNTVWENPAGRPFEIKITPRSQAHNDLIERGYKEVERADY